MFYLAFARPTLFELRSYTEYHLLRKASPKMASGPTGSGKSCGSVRRWVSNNMKWIAYHSHKGRNARTLDLQDVVVGGDGKVISAECEGHIRQRVAFLTVNRVLAIVGLLGTHFLVAEGKN